MFFDRALAIGSGFLGVLLFAGAVTHLREPVPGLARGPVPQVTRALVPVLAASGIRRRVYIVAWPTEPPLVLAPRRIVRKAVSPRPRLALRSIVAKSMRPAALRKTLNVAARTVARPVKPRTAATKARAPVVALRLLPKKKAAVRKRITVAPLPEPPVGYVPTTSVVGQTIDATTATSIAADTSDARVPSVIVFKHGR